ncbi:MAG TPA: CheR family methyltransferase [Terriglobales bacterium]|nr:CheR family methyltransferase [Terriglobales bacterium]
MTALTLAQLVHGLAADGGPDLRGYKPTTLERRVRKRMQELGIPDFAEYLEFVRKTPEEPAALLNTVLINVTEFFRDPQAWESLRTQVLPALLGSLRPGDSFRGWVAGCATGEEAYSVALLLAEHFGDELGQFDIRIYATDIDEDALNSARRGEYPAERLRRVRPQLYEKYFVRSGSMLRASRDLRRLLIFGRSNLVSNAPISHCQLCVCRNLLIYFDTPTQKRILERLHYALDPGGVLFLGKAESKLSESRLFRPINSRWRIFQRMAAPGDRIAGSPEVQQVSSDGRQDHELKTVRTYQRHILEAVRVGVFALDTGDVIITHNDTALALWDVARGKVVGKRLQDTELVARCPELIPRLEATRSTRNETVQFPCKIKTKSGDDRRLSIILRPVVSDEGVRVGTIVSCDDVTDREKLQTTLQQFEATSEELQSANEELETTNEELQSTNEELETTNEELQSSNEELETTNEELQSLNEELENMNEELEHRTQELTQVNARYTGTLQSMPWPVVLVDTRERIQLWNAAAQELFGVGATSVVGVDIDKLPLEEAARKTLVRRFRAVIAKGKASVLNRIHLRDHQSLGEFDIHFTPVSTSSGAVEGVLIMFGPVDGNGNSRTAAAKAARNQLPEREPRTNDSRKRK